jgi:hypothetical protein
MIFELYRTKLLNRGFSQLFNRSAVYHLTILFSVLKPDNLVFIVCL